MFPIPFGTRVNIEFHEPIERADKDAEALIERSRAIIAETIDGWRTS